MVEDKKNVKVSETNKTATGLPDNTEAALCYVFGWLSGLVFLLLVKDNKNIRFHALQSIVLFGGIQLLSIVLGISVVGAVLIPFVWLAAFGLWLFLIVKAYQGEKVELPVVSEWVNKQLK